MKVQDDLYVRDYERCILCYKCVEACGDDAQHTYAIATAGRGFDARISTEHDVTLPDSACDDRQPRLSLTASTASRKAFSLCRAPTSCSNSSRAEVKWLSQQVVAESAWEVVLEDVLVVVF